MGKKKRKTRYVEESSSSDKYEDFNISKELRKLVDEKKIEKSNKCFET